MYSHIYVYHILSGVYTLQKRVSFASHGRGVVVFMTYHMKILGTGHGSNRREACTFKQSHLSNPVKHSYD